MKNCTLKLFAWQRLVFSTAVLATSLFAVAPYSARAENLLKQPIAAPQFTVRGLNGDEIRSSSYRGKPILLMMWATWCPYCRPAMPGINALNERFKARGLVTLAISDEDVATMSAYAKDNRISIPLASPGAGIEKYRLSGVPSFALIDPQGQWVYSSKGYGDSVPDTLSALIEEQLQPKAPGDAAPQANRAPIASQQITMQQSAAESALERQYRRSADAQRRNKLPRNAKHNGIFVLDDDGGLTPVR